jgi:hypothetical protein
MMIFTHILVGILLSIAVADFFTLPVGYAVAVGGIGGLFPDVDMLFVHRKTLHYPVLFSILTLAAAIIYVLTTNRFASYTMIFATAAAAHSLMDTLGGGKEMRPWRETDQRAVYNHVQQEWVEPLRVFYDGSIPDLLIAIVSGVVIWYLLPSEYLLMVAPLISLSILYTLFRRVITKWIPEEYPTFSSYIQDKVR